MTYQVGDIVRYNMQLCPCTGGGIAQMEGPVVGILHNGQWFQIDNKNGTVVVKLQNIIGKIK